MKVWLVFMNKRDFKVCFLYWGVGFFFMVVGYFFIKLGVYN